MPELGRGLGRLTQPRGLFVSLGGGLGAGKTNRTTAQGLGGWLGGWKEVCNVARVGNKGQSPARSPRSDPRPTPLSRGAPGPLLWFGRAARPAHTRCSEGSEGSEPPLSPPPLQRLLSRVHGDPAGSLARRLEGQNSRQRNLTPLLNINPPRLRESRVANLHQRTRRLWNHCSHSSECSQGRGE